MNTELKPLIMDPLLQERLPLGFARILTHETILDDETIKRVTLDLPKYRHAAMYVRGSSKPISKLEL